jgi:hypothetical protein
MKNVLNVACIRHFLSLVLQTSGFFPHGHGPSTVDTRKIAPAGWQVPTENRMDYINRFSWRKTVETSYDALRAISNIELKIVYSVAQIHRRNLTLCATPFAS